MFGNFNKYVEQVQNIQSMMEQLQIESSVGEGAITTLINGRQNLLNIKIDPALINAGETNQLEDLLVAALNKAQQEAKQKAQEEIGKVTGLNLAGLDFNNLNLDNLI